MEIFRTAIFCLSALASSTVALTAGNPEAFMHPTAMIRFYGYPAELHRVVTADGYILELHRIPGRKGSHSVPVIIQHGITSSSADYLANRPPNNLPCFLSDHGYDVWLANSRENSYGQKHVVYKLDDPRFWDFYVDDLARFDLPAVISYVQRKTGFGRVHYIGHSQGTQSMFALLSQQPSFAKNIRLFTALAPVASLAHVKSPVLLGRFAAPFVRATNRNGQLRTSRLQRLARMCQIGHSAQWFCSYVTEFLNGSNRKSQDRKRADVYYSHYPHDVSLKNVEHLSQLNSHIGFRKFDYGPEKNLKMYGTPHPPDYPLGRISHVKIAFIFGMNDNLVERGDMNFLMRSLQRDVVYDIYTVPEDPQFHHQDFQWGTQNSKHLFKRILRNMENVDRLEAAFHKA